MKVLSKSKKFIIFGLMALLVFCMPFVLTGCSTAEAKSISIESSSVPKQSVEAGSFDISTLVIIIHKEDGTTQRVPGSSMMLTPVENAKLKIPGKQTVTLKYLGKETQFTIDLYPVGNPPTYKITFISGIDEQGNKDIVAEVNVPINRVITEDEKPKILENLDAYTPENPEDEAPEIPPHILVPQGYTVTWNNTDFENISTDTEIYAVYTPKTYTITLDAKNSTGKTTRQVTYGTRIGELPAPTKQANNFVGWRCDGVFITEDRIYDFTKDITLEAVYQKHSTETSSIAINMELYNCELPKELGLNEEVDLLEYKVKMTYNDGSTKIIPIDTSLQQFDSTGFDVEEEGENKTVIITYKNPSSSGVENLQIVHTYSVLKKSRVDIVFQQQELAGEYKLFQLVNGEYVEVEGRSSGIISSVTEEEFKNYTLAQKNKNTIKNYLLMVRPAKGYTYSFSREKMDTVAPSGDLIKINRAVSLEENEECGGIGWHYYTFSDLVANVQIKIQFKKMEASISIPEAIILKSYNLIVKYTFNGEEQLVLINEEDLKMLHKFQIDEGSEIEYVFKSKATITSFSEDICNYQLQSISKEKDDRFLVIKMRGEVGGINLDLTALNIKLTSVVDEDFPPEDYYEIPSEEPEEPEEPVEPEDPENPENPEGGEEGGSGENPGENPNPEDPEGGNEGEEGGENPGQEPGQEPGGEGSEGGDQLPGEEGSGEGEEGSGQQGSEGGLEE